MISGGAVEHERVDQAVAAAVVDVGVGVAIASQVGGVVGELEVGVGHERAADGAGPVRVGVQDDRVLGRDDGTLAEHLAGGAGVVRDGRVRVGSQRPFRGEVQGSGAERGQDPAFRRDAAGIELVEVVRHGRVGLPVGRDGFGVADPDPSRNRSLCRAAIRRYEAATSGASLAHMLTIAVATVIADVASRMRSARARSLTGARPNPSHAVGYPRDSAWIARHVRASSPYPGLSQAPIRPSRRPRCAGLTVPPRRARSPGWRSAHREARSDRSGRPRRRGSCPPDGRARGDVRRHPPRPPPSPP